MLACLQLLIPALKRMMRTTGKYLQYKLIPKQAKMLALLRI